MRIIITPTSLCFDKHLIKFTLMVCTGWSVTIVVEKKRRWINLESLKGKTDEILQWDALLISDHNFTVSSLDLITCKSLVSPSYINGVANWIK